MPAGSPPDDLPLGSPVWYSVGDESVADPYLQATVIKKHDEDDSFTLTLGQGDRKRLPRAEIFPANRKGHSNAPDDHCGLLHLNEATLLHSTRARAKFGACYTWVGSSQLLSVNPCEPVEGGVEQLCVR